MVKKKYISIFFIIAVLFFGAATYGLASTTQGSLWILQWFLDAEANISRATFSYSSGNLLNGMILRGAKFEDVHILDSKGEVSVSEAQIKVLWKKAVPYFNVSAESVGLRFSEIFNNATITNLSLNSEFLDLKNVMIYGLNGSLGNSPTKIGDVSILFPMEPKRIVRAKNISLLSMMGNISVGSVSGSQENLILESIEIREIPVLDKEAFVQIQKVKTLAPFQLSNIQAIENGKLNLPNSDPVIFYGTQKEGSLDVHMFSKNTELGNVLSTFRSLKGISAFVTDADISIKGSLDDLHMEGSLRMDHLAYRRFYIKNSDLSSLDLNVKKQGVSYELFGQINVAGGEILHKDIHLYLEPGKIIFKGDPELPFFDLKAKTKVADALIDVRLRGNSIKPDLSLSSSPPYPEEKILVMLATGKEWSGSERSISEGRLSMDAAAEFIDYFLLGGTGEKLSRRFGIKDLSVHADEFTKGVDLKKTISRKVDVGYGVEKKAAEANKGAVAQKVGVDYRTSANTLISVEGKVTSPSAAPDKLDAQDSLVDKSLTMKIKKSF